MTSDETAESPRLPRLLAVTWHARLFQGVLFLFLLTWLWFAVKPIGYSAALIRDYPFQLDREEGFLLNQALQLSRGETIYPSLSDYPYTVGNYTPVYPALYALALTVAEPTLSPGRVIVLVSVLGIVVLLGVLSVFLTRNWVLALLPACLLLTTYDWNQWIAYARVDFPALLFSVGGLSVALMRPGRKGLAVAGLLFCLAFYTKQTMLLAPVAVFAGLLCVRRFRDAWAFAAFTAALGLVVGLVLVVVTGGEFWKHTVTYNANVLEWWQVRAGARHLWFFGRWWIVLLILCLALSAYGMLRQRVERSGFPARYVNAVLFVYTLLAVLSLLSLAKRGSAVNYYLEFQAVAALLITVVLGRVFELADGGLRKAYIPFGLIGLFLLVHFVRMVQLSMFIHTPPAGMDERLRAEQCLLKVMSADGEVLTEDPVLNIMARKEVLYQPFIMAQLAREGRWDPMAFEADLKARRFSLIVTEKDLSREYFYGFTEHMRDLILGGYVLGEIIVTGPGQTRYFYVPDAEKPGDGVDMP